MNFGLIHFRVRRVFAILLAGAALAACTPKDISLPVVIVTPSASPATAYSGFTGLVSAQTTGATKVKLTWNASSDASVVAYNVYDVTSLYSPKLITTVRAPASSTSLTGLSNEHYYSFRVRAADANDNEDTNTNDMGAIPYAGVLTASPTSATAANTPKSP